VSSTTDTVVPDSYGIHDAELDRLFGAGGPLGGAVGNYRPRHAQTQMAKAIAEAIAGQTTLIAEAGTVPARPLPIWCPPCCGVAR